MCVRVDEREVVVSTQENAGPLESRRNVPGNGGRVFALAITPKPIAILAVPLVTAWPLQAIRLTNISYQR